MRSSRKRPSRRTNISSLSTTAWNPCRRDLVTFDITSQNRITNHEMSFARTAGAGTTTMTVRGSTDGSTFSTIGSTSSTTSSVTWSGDYRLVRVEFGGFSDGLFRHTQRREDERRHVDGEDQLALHGHLPGVIAKVDADLNHLNNNCY